MSPFARHIARCNLPPSVELRPFSVAGQQVGMLAPAIRAALVGAPEFRADALHPAENTAAAHTAALAALSARLAGAGLVTMRGEPFDVRATPAGPVLATLDRGALPAFGIAATGVHLNGLVRRTDGLHLWVAVRARDKAVAPGQLDNLVAGGTPAGHDAWSTMLKEAEEEACLPLEVASRARPVARITYVMWTPQGLRRDTLNCFDLDVPEGVSPCPGDGEVERFELWPIAQVVAAVRDTEDVKFNVNLVLIDLFLRERLIDPGSAEGRTLRAGLVRF